MLAFCSVSLRSLVSAFIVLNASNRRRSGEKRKSTTTNCCHRDEITAEKTYREQSLILHRG